jgi:hypothetical protein
MLDFSSKVLTLVLVSNLTPIGRDFNLWVLLCLRLDKGCI